MGAGKVTVHTAAAGLDPRWTLPIALDVGCDTFAVREDPLYVGLNQVTPHAVVRLPVIGGSILKHVTGVSYLPHLLFRLSCVGVCSRSALRLTISCYIRV